MPLKNRILMIVTAAGLGLGLGWVIPAQQAAAEKKWQGKDGGQEEYQLYEKATKNADAKTRVAQLEEWQTRFPNSDFWESREDVFLITYQQVGDARKSFDMAKQIRTKRPNHWLSIDAILRGFYSLNPTNPAPADLDYAEQTAKYVLDNIDTIYAPANKPGTIPDPKAFESDKPRMRNLAQQTLAFTAWTRKPRDPVKAEAEIRKFLGIDGTQAQFTYWLAQLLFEQKDKNLDKYIPEAIFHFARAGNYDGKNALPAADRPKIAQYAQSLYTQYHGSAEGFPQIVTLAKANVMPPANFAIKSITQIQQEEIANQEKFDAEHPDLAFWRRALREPLQGPDGATFFENNVKEALLPGPTGQEKGFPKFKATIVSSTQDKAGNTNQLVVAVEKPQTADATLDLGEPLPGMMEPGSQIQFDGTVKSFAAMPFMLVFESNAEEKERGTVEGWTGVATKASPKGKTGAKANKAAPKGTKAKK